MIADHHNVYDFTEWYWFIGIATFFCVALGILLKFLEDDFD